MAFFRELWMYVTKPVALQAAQSEPLRWSFLFQLHVLVAFVVSLAFMSDVIALVRQAEQTMARVPDGIIIEKRGEKFVLAGVPQPITFDNLGMTVTVDTTGVMKSRPASTTLFITDTQLVSVDSTGRESVSLWKNEADFTQSIDEIKKFWLSSERKLVLLGAAGIFGALLIFTTLITAGLVVGWSVLALIFAKIFKKGSGVTMRQSIRVHALCITGPLLLWAALTIGGFGIATEVEAVAFVVYSMMALPPQKAITM